MTQTMTAYLQGEIEKWNQRAEETDNQKHRDVFIERASECEFRFDRYKLYNVDPNRMTIEDIDFKS